MKRFLVLICLCAQPLYAVLDLKTFTRVELPIGVVTSAVYNNAVYVGGSDGNNHGIWKTNDGETWEPIPLPFTGFIHNLCAHNGSLYVSGVTYSQNGLVSNYWIYRLNNDGSWTTIPLPLAGVGINDPVSDGTYLYVLAGPYYTTNKIWRTTGELPIIWQAESLPVDGGVTPSPFRLAVAQSHLVAFTYDGNTDHGSLYYKVGSNFRLLYKTTSSLGFFRYHTPAVRGNSLFFQIMTLNEFKLDTQPVTLVDYGVGATPFELFGEIYAQKSDGAMIKLGADGQTQPVDLGAFRIGYNQNQLCHIKDIAIFFQHRLRKGVTQVQLNPISSKSVFAGQNNELVLSFNISLSVRETLNGLTIKNIGTAEAGTDIRSLQLFRQASGSRVLIADLTANGDGKMWATRSNLSHALIDGETLMILANFTPTARAGRTVQFAIPQNGMAWTETQSYQLPGTLVVPDEEALTISGSPARAGPAPINGAVVYPIPAFDSASISYDLEASAGINIKIYDRAGVLVSEINESQAAGRATTVWDASGAAPGIYYALIKIKESSGRDRSVKKKIYIEK